MSIMRIATFILSIFIVGMVEMMVAGIMNLMSIDLHVSEAIIGQLVTLYAITFAIAGPILVKITNRFSPRPVLLYALLVFIVGNMIIAFAPNFSILVFGRIISSAAAALIVVKILALTALLTAPQHRGKMIGIVYSGFSGANVLGVPIGTIIGDLVGWRYTFLFIVFVSVLVGILMYFYVPQPQYQTVNTESSTKQRESNYSKILRPGEVAKFLAITFLLLVANSVTFIYINPLMLSSGHDLSFVSIVLLINGVAGVIGTSMGGFLSDKLTSKRWLTIATIIFITMMLLLNLFLSVTGVLLMIIFIWNIMQWSTNPAVQSGIIEHVEGDTSQVMSWNMSSLNAGIGIGGIVGGLVVSKIDVLATTYFTAAIAFVAFILIISLKQMTKFNRA
ncbi:chloramphenicol resistance protein [Staphylococcus saprophyticus]|jgi:DHA1 family purine base/nucleoside efflux pump-like MFS transporter|uniref:Putative transporter n=1 Tax=Staphylococcus saprophyticus subsp. saprophyticus (strain ATCC 15305 / DSM 20229 / NCIMB 8711 / NCTC 7292 / S-41) TaxID=342451 RepID=Q4A030_STAS1|nr:MULTISPECIES: MFS transporter [Staphylococcus]AMG19524.1 MFS transporter [Staphylococcus saprophyticus]AMG32638.1 MFS transporter [Staphylococcus saprophyticus]ASE58578.1 MFS transporter [Staphylococcus saprophyticus]ASF19547.1 MFS transporter [Staphylococcus saprophyticus]MBC2919923.1 MFS transporter [Staphylococcus saprophyticus]